MTKLKWKLFTKIIKRPSDEAWVDRQSVQLREKHKHFNLESGQRNFAQKRILITDPKIVIVY